MAQTIFTMLGLLGVLAGTLNRRTYLVFRSTTFDSAAQRRWRMADSNSDDARHLVAVVLFAELRTLRRLALPDEAVAAAAQPGLRSVLLVPADRPLALPAALDARPDAVCLDLCGLVYPTRRYQARALAWSEVTAASKSYSRVLVRVDPETLEEDLEACVWPGLSCIMMSVEGPEALAELDVALTVSGTQAAHPRPGPRRGHADVGQRAVGCARDHRREPPRRGSWSSGTGDLAFDTTGVDEQAPYLTGPHPRFPSQSYVWGRAALAAAAGGVRLLGMLGTTVAPGRLDEALGDGAQERLNSAARLARLAGFHGAVTLHPEAVAACADGFTTPEATIAEARRTLDDAACGEPVPHSRIRLAVALLRNGPVSAPEEVAP